VSKHNVYVIECPAVGVVKIGLSIGVAARLEALRAASPSELSLLVVFTGAGHAVERWLHRCFADQRTHHEWFRREGLLDQWLTGKRGRIKWEGAHSPLPMPDNWASASQGRAWRLRVAEAAFSPPAAGSCWVCSEPVSSTTACQDVVGGLVANFHPKCWDKRPTYATS
jgi:hypothetical protein